MIFFVNGRCSNGFGIADDDGLVNDNEKGQRKLVCGTTKVNHEENEKRLVCYEVNAHAGLHACNPTL